MSSFSFKIEKPNHHQKKENNEFHSSDDTDEEFQTNPNFKKKPKLEIIDEFDSTDQERKEDVQKDFLIPALPNRDFRSIYLHKKSKKPIYKPEMLNSFGKPSTTKETTKGIENVDRMNSSNVSGGLKVIEQPEQPKIISVEKMEVQENGVVEQEVPEAGLSLEEKAIQELMKESGRKSDPEKKEIQPILMKTEPSRSPSLSPSTSNSFEDETSMFRKDVSKRPNPSSLEDYERVPVGSFGLALLKGMGWKEGTSASKNGRVGLLEAVVPKPRPSLLGIGAKALVLTEGSSKGTGMVRKFKGKDDRKYVPLVRKLIDPEIRGSDSRSSKPSSSRSYARSRSGSPSTSRSTSYREKSPSRSEKHNKSRYLDDEERNLKGLRIEDGGERSRRDGRDSGRYYDREEKSRRNDQDSRDRRYREEGDERSRRDHRDHHDREERSRRDDTGRDRYQEREERSRRKDTDGHYDREEREGKSRRDGRDDERGTYRMDRKDEDRYRKSYK
ncbi:uncharacterized protein MELLADRAFT_109237 [Melampsora larici-populina 98AG31]|uniref:G-patch domain-containing protein n=1 Tax=Melampsora larici-populina (strain 98AG31 / pathotype 3-4-7) TaxID=747676 RepID=F4RVU0_MELLP|nr:uncharacterized protein MELLADRAFT_109237 [Melampsora larici-populina 98AG31]EGG03523.1 hypothetical protein MELLADRAFT_109237 [Melampsora larici-populina 98AG31]